MLGPVPGQQRNGAQIKQPDFMHAVLAVLAKKTVHRFTFKAAHSARCCAKFCRIDHQQSIAFADGASPT